jgi:carbonic anhydrase/acetyltransferase-like protein (isoleucine patch superfamily)
MSWRSSTAGNLVLARVGVGRLTIDVVTLYARWRDVAAAGTHRLWEWLRWAGAIGPQDRIARRYHAFGAGTLIAFPPGDVFGEEHIALGAGTLLAPHVSLSVGMAPGQPLPPGATTPVLRIGSRCSIGRASHVVAHRSVVIGDDVITGPHCYITDQNHVYADPDVPVGQQWPTEDAVAIGNGSWLGAGAIVLPGARLGCNTVVGAGAVVRGEFADHVVLVGAPARVVRRYEPGDGWQPALRELHIEPPAGWEPTRQRTP